MADDNEQIKLVKIDYRDDLGTKSIQDIFGGCTRQWVSVLAKREKWPKLPSGPENEYYYSREDVVNSWKAHHRTLLYKKFACVPNQAGGSRLLRTSSMDTFCPKCGAFAIRFPDTYLPTKVRPHTPSHPVTSCVAGHIIPIKEAHAQ